MRHFAFIALGTGVGLGIIADGQCCAARCGAAGEIAYLRSAGSVDPGSFTQGTFETAVSSAAILRRYRGNGGA